DAQVAEIEQLTADNPVQQARMSELRTRLAARMQALNENLKLRQDEGFDAARASIATHRGKQLMDELRTFIGTMTQHERELLVERDTKSDRTYRESLTTGLMSGLMALVAAAAVLVLFVRQLKVRHAAASTIAEQRERLRTTLASIGDAVITTDVDGNVTNLNPVAETLTGWTTGEARGQPLETVFRIVNEETRQTVENPATRALREGVIVGLANHTVLIAKDGRERAIDDSAAPIRCKDGEIVGCVLVFRDVTERREADNIVRRSERVLSDFFDQASVGLHWVGPDGIILRANQTELDMLGYHREEYVGRSITEFHVDQPVIQDILACLTRGQTLHEYPSRMRRKDGAIRDVLINSSAYTEAGKFVHTRCFTRDVTELKQAELDLRRSEAHKRLMFETTLDCIISIDHEGTVTEFNAAAERTFVLRREDAIGRELASLIIPPAYREPHRQGLARYLATGEGPVLNQRLELSALRADGSEFPIELTVTRIPLDGPPVFTAYLRDITERKAVERAQARLAAIVATSEDAIISKSSEGIIQTWNAAAERLFGYSAEEATGKHITLIIPTDRLAEEDQIIAQLKAGEAFEHFQTIRQRKDGRLVDVSITVSPLIDAEGKFVGASKIVRDITRDKAAEQKIRGLMEDLQDADRRKDEFLATLAHELRNPLAPIRNTLEILKHQDLDRERLMEARGTMERQLGQMVRLVDDLLDVSRITRDRLELRRERVELASIVHHAVESSRPLAEAAGHHLTVTLPQDHCYLDADPVRLAQVFGNLLSNACKYTEPGGKIDLVAEQVDDHVVVKIKDTGIGIPADKLDAIFEMFAQVTTALEHSQGGLGIGLTLVKRLVELHGGQVQVSSDGLGQGSEFRVRLPLLTQPPKSPRTPSPPPAEQTPIMSRRILVVDDNKDAAFTLSMLLKITGNETMLAHDGLEAVAAAERFRPDLVLLDIGLPKLNGYEVARRIRAEPWGQSMVLVASTGWGQDEDRRKSQEAGFNHHLVKPIRHDDLEKLLKECDGNSP
ncbi:MAG TPA: PAS domain S-box protein, partial [Planctomycetaceae bacterium]|nr:PAS domain S-box protein [Planctomycetaceae bacterium]